MTRDEQQTTNTEQQRSHTPRPKDDEQLAKEQIDKTGEPNRDAIGNQDGAS